MNNLIQKLETFYPLELCTEWDNSGWQIFLDGIEKPKILLCLTPTLDVVEQAKTLNCNLIISHHPVLMEGIKSIDIKGHKVIIEAIRNDISIYSMHTNLDIAQGGTSDTLAEKLGLRNIETLFDFVKIGYVDEITLGEFIKNIKKALSVDFVRLSGERQTLRKVAVCAGGGGSFVPMLNGKDIDVFVAGDLKYHDTLQTSEFAILDVGHFESEVIILPKLKALLKGYDVVIAEEKTPFKTD